MSGTQGWSPAEVAAHDQETAAADAEVDLLARALRVGIAESGPVQASADIYCVLAARWDATQMAVLLVAALRRIAANGESRSPPPPPPEPPCRR